MFNNILKLMEARGLVSDSLTLKCKNHGREYVVKKPEDFDTVTPFGGCTLACGKRLECGHSCRQMCHPDEHLRNTQVSSYT